MAYTSVDLVSAELGGVTISSSTTPSSDDVETWIKEVEDEINERTGRVWKPTQETVYLDYDSSRPFFKLPKTPVISVDDVKYEENGLGADSESWVTATEGRTEDYIFYESEGIIRFFGNNIPSTGYKNVKITYTYGQSSTPKIIKRLATLMVARRYIDAVVNKSATEADGGISVGVISLSDPTTFSLERIRSLNEQIKSLFAKLGSGFKSRTTLVRW